MDGNRGKYHHDLPFHWNSKKPHKRTWETYPGIYYNKYPTLHWKTDTPIPELHSTLPLRDKLHYISHTTEDWIRIRQVHGGWDSNVSATVQIDDAKFSHWHKGNIYSPEVEPHKLRHLHVYSQLGNWKVQSVCEGESGWVENKGWENEWYNYQTLQGIPDGIIQIIYEIHIHQTRPVQQLIQYITWQVHYFHFEQVINNEKGQQVELRVPPKRANFSPCLCSGETQGRQP